MHQKENHQTFMVHLWSSNSYTKWGKGMLLMTLPEKPTIHRRRGKGLLHKKESVKEFAVRTKIKYASCMDPLLEGD